MNKDLVMLVGRVMLATIFVVAGYNKLLHFPAVAAAMANKGLAMPNTLLILSIIIELGAGTMLLVGMLARSTAFIIFLFIMPVTYVYHPFWSVPAELNNFLKNMAIMGGLLYVALHGPGRYSIPSGFLNRLLWRLHGGH